MGLGSFNASKVQLPSQKTESCDLGETLFALGHDISEGTQAQPQTMQFADVPSLVWSVFCRALTAAFSWVKFCSDKGHGWEGKGGPGTGPWLHPLWCTAPFLCLHTALVQGGPQWWQERVKCKSMNGSLSSCFSCYSLLLLSLGILVSVISYLEWKDFFFLLLNVWEIWGC